MANENRVRIKDIAQELGVSTATVSNVIHGKTKKISAKTIELVQQKLEERGYVPNMAATLLAQNNSRIIGVVVCDDERYKGHTMEEPFIAASLNFLSKEIDRAGCFMMVRQIESIQGAAQFASMWNMDGMIAIGFGEEDCHMLRGNIKIPLVVYDGSFHNLGRICNLTVDNFSGGKQMGRHLWILGHRKALFLSDTDIPAADSSDKDKVVPNNTDRAEQIAKRFDGFCRGFGAEEGQEVHFMKVPSGKQERLGYYNEHWKEIQEYSAIFAVSDYYAAELMQCLIRRGIRVPEDVSVAGFGSSLVCELVEPNLTSVWQDGAMRASFALELLKKMEQIPGYSGEYLMPVKLITRDSTAVCSKHSLRIER